MEKKPAMMDVMMMAIFLDSSSRYSLSRSFSSSISSSSSSSSSDSLSELSSSGSSMLSSLGLSILYWKKWTVWFCFSICYVCSIATFSRSFWRIASRSSSCFLEKLDFQLWDDFLFLSLCLGTIIFLWHLYFSFLSSFVSPASLLLLSSSPENPVNVWGFKTRKKDAICLFLFHIITNWYWGLDISKWRNNGT